MACNKIKPSALKRGALRAARPAKEGLSGSIAMILSVVFLASAGVTSCAGSSPRPCITPQPWSGNCQLRSVVKSREMELPVPMTVFEAIYTPQPNAAAPNQTPPEVRVEYQARGIHAAALVEHLRQHEMVSCHTTPPAPDSCYPGPVRVDVPPFDAQASVARSNEPVGCAKINAGFTQPSDVPIRTPQSFSKALLFEEGQAMIAESSISVLEDMAFDIKSDPSIECVTVVGSVAAGEPQLLANQRARAIKAALVQRGVETERLEELSATVTAQSLGPRIADPEERRVILRVVLSKAP